MSLAETTVPFASVQHLVLAGVSWNFYETVLEGVGDGRVRVTYDDGDMEIMSPPPKYNVSSRLLGQLVFLLCLERKVEMLPFGSTTFRDQEKRKGLEPDECFYIQHAKQSRAIIERFDSSIHPPPDLAIEVDITNRSIAREPVYAALGVPELWRVRIGSIQCLVLTPDGAYQDSAFSIAFPFLQPTELWRWVVQLRDNGALATVPAFEAWVRDLK